FLSSLMPDRLQLRPHLLAGALDAHLESGFARSRERGDLRVLEPLAVLEQKSLAQLGLELAERRIESIPPLEPRRRSGRALVGALAQGFPVAHHDPSAASPSARQGSAAVDENAKEPRTKGFALHVAPERTKRAQERFLKRVFGILSLTQVAPREAPEV